MDKPMPKGKDSDTVLAVIPKSLKEQLKKYAKKHRWTLSQAVRYLIEIGLEGEEDS